MLQIRTENGFPIEVELQNLNSFFAVFVAILTRVCEIAMLKVTSHNFQTEETWGGRETELER